jgi:hypothetical protein
MAANHAEFQRELLQTIASFNGDRDFSVTSQVEPLLDGPAFTVSLKFEDMVSSAIDFFVPRFPMLRR